MGTTALSWAVFSSSHPYLYLIFIALAWLSTRERLWVVGASVALIDMAAVASAIGGHGPFSSPVITEVFWHLQAFVLAASVCGLVLYASSAERRRALFAARRHNEELKRHIREQHSEIDGIKNALAQIRRAKDTLSGRT